MRWMKHMCTSWEDEKIARLVGSGGMEGLAMYGLYWRVQEIIASKMEGPSPECSVSYPISMWSRLLSLRGSLVFSTLSRLAVTWERQGSDTLVTVERHGDEVRVTNRKLLKFRDEYSRKFGVTPEQVAPDTDTDTDTETDKKPSRAKRTGGESSGEVPQESAPKKPKGRRKSADGMTHSVDPRHTGCKEAIFAYYRSKNNVDPDWDGAEGKALGMFLNANPEIGPDQVTAMLRNRFLSDVNHGDRPAKWIRGLKSFLGGPVDRFGKPMHQTAAKIDRNSERYTWRQKEQEEMIRRGDLVQ